MAEPVSGFPRQICHRHRPALQLRTADDGPPALEDGGALAQSTSWRPKAEDRRGKRSANFPNPQKPVNKPRFVWCRLTTSQGMYLIQSDPNQGKSSDE